VDATPNPKASAGVSNSRLARARFALVAGDPGVGKSAALRLLSEHLNGYYAICAWAS